MHFSAELSVRDTSALVPNWHQCKNARHFGTKHKSAEMSWVRSVLGPKCPYTHRITTEIILFSLY